MQEIEAKILEVDVEAVRDRLRELGAELEFEEELHAVYFNTGEEKGETLRLRKEGDRCQLVWKDAGQARQGVLERKELETTVGDLETMRAILKQLGFAEGKEMRKIRSQFALEGVHVVIDRYLDEYSYIPTYLEIEGGNLPEVEAAAKKLGYAGKDLEALTIAELVPRYAHLR